MANEISIVMVDDHVLIRRGIISTFAHNPRLKVVGEGTYGCEVEPLLEKHNPDVLILDIHMKQFSDSSAIFYPVETVEKIKKKHPSLTIIILTGGDESATIQSLATVDVAGFVSKADAFTADLDKAIEMIHGGATYFSKEIIRILRDEAPLPPTVELSFREREVLTVEIEYSDSTREERAALLNLVPSTISNHLGKIKQKMGVDNLRTCLILAIRQNLLLPISQWDWLDDDQE